MRHVAKKLFRFLILYVGIFPLYWIGHLSPRDKRLWVFGNGNGTFSDNCRFVMECVHRTQPDIRTHWLAHNRSERDTARALGYSASLLWSLRGIFIGYRAGLGFEAISHADLNRATLGGMKIVQLWHGVPLKRLHLDTKFNAWWIDGWYSKIVGFVRNRLLPFASDRYDMVTAASQLSAERLSSAFGLPTSAIRVTGDPRVDVILSRLLPRPMVFESMKISDRTKVILFAPTFRGHGGMKGIEGGIDKGAWEDMLLRRGAVLLIKLHPFAREADEFKERFAQSSLIRVLGSHECEDINTLLPFVDILATDYSSVMFDYCILDRPIVFFAPDLQAYSAERGLYEDYDILSEGRYAKSWDEFKRELDSCIQNDAWHKERSVRLKMRYHVYFDAKNCERIIAASRALINI